MKFTSSVLTGVGVYTKTGGLFGVELTAGVAALAL
jgi:hypothetical protein